MTRTARCQTVINYKTCFKILNTSSSDTVHGEFAVMSNLRAASAAAVTLSSEILRSFKSIGTPNADMDLRMASTAEFAASAGVAAFAAPSNEAIRAIFSGRALTSRSAIAGKSAAEHCGFGIPQRALIAVESAEPTPGELTEEPIDMSIAACAKVSACEPPAAFFNNLAKKVIAFSKSVSERKFAFEEQYDSTAEKIPSKINTDEELSESIVIKLQSIIIAA